MWGRSRATTPDCCGARGVAVTRQIFTGTQRSMIANRVSYFLGARGPSLTVDTGQSSGLVSVHMACESLRAGESSMALAGGVNLNVGPDSALELAALGALSPDGRCFTFDAGRMASCEERGAVWSSSSRSTPPWRAAIGSWV